MSPFQVIRPIRKLTILAMGRSINEWISQTYLNPDFGEIWTINNGGLMFRHDVLWDMHTDEYLAALSELDRSRVSVRRALLQSHDRPIVMPKADIGIPTSVTFPLKDIIDLTQSSWFNNGTAYMLAAALCCKVDRLHLYGVDFVGSQYEAQRACTMYWLGRLIQAGCRIGGVGPLVYDMQRQSGAVLYGYHEPAMFEYGGIEPVFSGPNY